MSRIAIASVAAAATVAACVWAAPVGAAPRRGGASVAALQAAYIAVGTVGGRTLVRLRGHGLDGNGGHADVASDLVYTWQGSGVAVATDASITAR